MYFIIKNQTMKHLYLAICCLCVGLISHAQFNKGQRMIGGNFNFYANDYQSNNTLVDNVSFGTQFSYSKFVKPLSFYSIGVNYNYSGTPNMSNSNGFGISYGYTQLQTLAKKFYIGIAGSGSTNLSIANNYNLSGNINNKSIGWNIQANAVVDLYYQLNNRFLLSTSLVNLVTIRYATQEYKTLDANNNLSNGNTNSSWSVNTGLTGFSLNNLGIGVKYLLK
jgi:hypothetical protein